MTHCPRCGNVVAPGQEYCLECGLRLPGITRLGPPPEGSRALLITIAVAAVVAAGGAAAAIALNHQGTATTPILTATGGSEVAPESTVAASTGLVQWPADTSAWTNILISVPKVEGRDAAVARADAARKRGLRQVGVLDSSRFASLSPGYWVVFAGIYASEPEATSRLREARSAQRGARTARISR